MKDIKKLMITLVALLAVTTGAWADGIVCTASDLGKVLCTDGSIYENVSAATTAGKTAAAVIAYVDETNKNGLAIALADEGEMNWSTAVSTCEGKTPTVTGAKWCLPSQEQWKQMFKANGDNEGSYTGMNTTITNAGGTTLPEGVMYWSSLEYSPDTYAYNVWLHEGKANWNFDDEGTDFIQARACLAFDIAAASGPEVAWDKAAKTGTFKMPGGNVTLEPEYYPQATVADGGVTAADADARATTDDPLVKVDATKLTGAKKLMYFVSNSGTTAPAYDAEGWTDQLPTAEGFTQQGIVYVWYYPVGTDEGVDGATATYSDGDICLQSITARIADAPTYAVTFAEGTDPNEWKASPAAGVTKGQTVTVTYTGSKKVIGVKAEEKKAAVAVRPLAEATAEDLGKIAGADGNIYDTKAAAETAGTTAVAMIAYVGSDTGNDTYTHGLAIALSEEDEMNWSNAKSTCEGKSAVSGAAWLLPSRNQWKTMFKANGGDDTKYTGLNTALATAGGDSSKLQKNERYWSSSELDADFAWVLIIGEDSAGWDGAPKDLGHHVLGCLAF